MITRAAAASDETEWMDGAGQGHVLLTLGGLFATLRSLALTAELLPASLLTARFTQQHDFFYSTQSLVERFAHNSHHQCVCLCRVGHGTKRFSHRAHTTQKLRSTNTTQKSRTASTKLGSQTLAHPPVNVPERPKQTRPARALNSGQWPL